MKHVHKVPESCLRRCIENVSEVDVDSIDLHVLSVGFMRYKMHFLHVMLTLLTCLPPRRGGAQTTGSCDRSLEIHRQTKTTSRCKQWWEYGNGSTAWYIDGWGRFQKDLYQGEEKKGRHPPASLRYMVADFILRQDAGRVMLGTMMMIAFNTIKSSLVPLIEGLCVQI